MHFMDHHGTPNRESGDNAPLRVSQHTFGGFDLDRTLVEGICPKSTSEVGVLVWVQSIDNR